MKKTTINVTFTLLLLFGLAVLLSNGLKKAEMNQCTTHVEQFDQYSDYYLTQADFDMCLHYDIIVEDDFEMTSDGGFILRALPF